MAALEQIMGKFDGIVEATRDDNPDVIEAMRARTPEQSAFWYVKMLEHLLEDGLFDQLVTIELGQKAVTLRVRIRFDQEGPYMSVTNIQTREVLSAVFFKYKRNLANGAIIPVLENALQEVGKLDNVELTRVAYSAFKGRVKVLEDFRRVRNDLAETIPLVPTEDDRTGEDGVRKATAYAVGTALPSEAVMIAPGELGNLRKDLVAIQATMGNVRLVYNSVKGLTGLGSESAVKVVIEFQPNTSIQVVLFSADPARRGLPLTQVTFPALIDRAGKVVIDGVFSVYGFQAMLDAIAAMKPDQKTRL